MTVVCQCSRRLATKDETFMPWSERSLHKALYIHTDRQTYKHILKFFRKKRNYGWILNEMNLLTLHKSPGYHNMSIVVNSLMHWFTWEIEAIGSEVQGHLGSSRPSWFTAETLSQKEKSEWGGGKKREWTRSRSYLSSPISQPSFELEDVSSRGTNTVQNNSKDNWKLADWPVGTFNPDKHLILLLFYIRCWSYTWYSEIWLFRAQYELWDRPPGRNAQKSGGVPCWPQVVLSCPMWTENHSSFPPSVICSFQIELVLQWQHTEHKVSEPWHPTVVLCHVWLSQSIIHTAWKSLSKGLPAPVIWEPTHHSLIPHGLPLYLDEL